MNAFHTPVVNTTDELRAIVGDEHVRAATPADAIDGVQPQFVIEPGNEQEVARVLKVADAAGLALAPRGGGTKLRWGNRPQRLDAVLSLARMDRVIEHAAADLTVTVEAGCTIAALQAALAKANQRLALDPLWPERATIGGVLATNDSGALRIRYGALRDLIIGITLALPDGTLARSGGKVVKNVAGYDLPKLATGSLGTLAVITQAIFRLHPLSRETRSFTVVAKNAAEANQAVLALLDSKLAYTGLQIRAARGQAPQGACVPGGPAFGPLGWEVDVRFEGTAAGVEAQSAELARMLRSDRVVESAADVWSIRPQLFSDSALVAKVSTLPAEWASFCDRAAADIERVGADWRLVAQGGGLGNLQVTTDGGADLQPLIARLRSLLEPGGSLVVLQCPLELKDKIDVWGPPGDGLSLMRRIKREFDPKSTLNPGRFIGGI